MIEPPPTLSKMGPPAEPACVGRARPLVRLSSATALPRRVALPRPTIARRRSWLIHFYLARVAMPIFGGVIVVMIMALMLENLPRLLDELQSVGRPGWLLWRSIVGLAPEYFALGLPVGLFFAVALTFRRLAIDSELDALASVGVAPAQLLIVPIVAGLLTGVLQFTVRGYSEPSGEAELYRLGQAFHSGDLGLDIRAGQFIRPAPDVSLMIERIEQPSHHLRGIFVKSGDDIVSAAGGSLRFSGQGIMRLTLQNGVLIHGQEPARRVAIRFNSLATTLPIPHTTPRAEPLADILSRLDNSALRELSSEAGPRAVPARAVLAERVASALFCLGLPLLAYGVSIPPKKSTSSIGLALGLVAIIAFVRGSASITQGFANHALSLQAAALALWCVVASVAAWLEIHHGPGAVIGALQRMRRWLADRLHQH